MRRGACRVHLQRKSDAAPLPLPALPVPGGHPRQHAITVLSPWNGGTPWHAARRQKSAPRGRPATLSAVETTTTAHPASAWPPATRRENTHSKSTLSLTHSLGAQRGPEASPEARSRLRSESAVSPGTVLTWNKRKQNGVTPLALELRPRPALAECGSRAGSGRVVAGASWSLQPGGCWSHRGLTRLDAGGLIGYTTPVIVTPNTFRVINARRV